MLSACLFLHDVQLENADFLFLLLFDRWILFVTKSRFATSGVLKSWYVHALMITARNMIFLFQNLRIETIKTQK